MAFFKRTLAWLKQNIWLVVIFLILCFLANLFLWLFLKSEKFIYFWDWSFYESRFALIVNKFHEGFIPALKELRRSIAFSEQSLIPPFVIAPLGLLFGATRKVFLFSILNIFAIPAALVLGFGFAKLVGAKSQKFFLCILICFSVIFLTPQFWIPITLGFYDVSTLILVGIIWLILLSDQKNRPFAKAALVGFLLTMLVLTRRWFGYWDIGFFLSLGFFWALSKIKKTEPFWKLSSIAVCGAAAIFIFIILALPIMRQMITNNYADMFRAFKSGDSAFQIITGSAIHYGWLSLILAAGGYFLAIKKSGKAQFINLICLQSLFALLLFSKVQRVDQHHHYQFICLLVLLQCLFIYYFWHLNVKRIWKIGCLSLFIGILTANFLIALNPKFHSNPLLTGHFFAGARHYPLYRSDTDEIFKLVEFINTQKSQSVYVLASSIEFNDDVLRNSCLYLSIEAQKCKNILQSSHVDLRDGFPKQFLTADLVVVADPVQFHLRPEDQQVVGILAEQMLNNKILGNAFTAFDKNFYLEHGLKIKIYKKVREFTPAELQKTSNIFLNFYPNRENLFKF